MVFRFWNGAQPTTAISAAVTTGTALKTMLVAASIGPGKVIEWGCFFNASAAAVPIPVELLETDVAVTTMTAHAEADVIELSPAIGALAATYFTLSGSGYTATVEGTPTSASRLLDFALIPPTGGLVKQFPLGREPVLTAGDWLRIRLDAAAAVDCLCYFDIEVG